MSGSGGVDREVNSPARADLSSVALAKEEGGASPVPKNDLDNAELYSVIDYNYSGFSIEKQIINLQSRDEDF